jgi:hypothetical protein
MQPSFRASLVVAALGLAVGLGLVASSCGPKQKFCPDAGDGVCRSPPDATVDMGVDTTSADTPPADMSVFVTSDSGTD